MSNEFQRLVTESTPLAQKVLAYYKNRQNSLFDRQPNPGHLRGIDFYTNAGLVKVVAFLIARHKILYNEDLNLLIPQSYTEKINWSKLFREFKVPITGNKLLTTRFIPPSIQGLLSCPPVVWRSPLPNLPDNNSIAPGEYYLKSNHGSGRTKKIIYPISESERRATENLAAGWLKNPYGIRSGEWFYNVFQPELLLDRSVTSDPESISWNVYIFGGEIEMISAHQKTQSGSARSTWFNQDFTPFRFQRSTKERAVVLDLSNQSKADIVKFALEVAKEIDNVRVDFFVGDEGRVYLGEVTFTTLNGTRGGTTASDREFDYSFGHKWLIDDKA